MPPWPSAPFQITAPNQNGNQNTSSGKKGVEMNQMRGKATNTRQQPPPLLLEADDGGVGFVGISRR